MRTRSSATPTPVAGPPPQVNAPPPTYPAQQPAPQYPAQQPPAQPFVDAPPPTYSPPAQEAPVYAPPPVAAAPPAAPQPVYQQPVQQRQMSPYEEIRQATGAYGDSPLHQFSMENDGSYVPIPNDTRVEAELMEARLAPAKNGSGNMVLNLRWRTTWPAAYVNARIYDNVTMTADWAAKYQSLFRNCEGPQGQPLLSPDGLRYTGTSVQTGPNDWEFPDLIGNVVAFKTRQDETNTGREVNKIYGNYERATETQGMAVESSGNGAAVASGPPAQVDWRP